MDMILSVAVVLLGWLVIAAMVAGLLYRLGTSAFAKGFLQQLTHRYFARGG